ncbi:MAG: hypothetical protein GF381_00640 [Candidatus Pacebacteria bacterium]|nr:hypothetical protein [Candidatus Paceibacterota bacterium]
MIKKNRKITACIFSLILMGQVILSFPVSSIQTLANTTEETDEQQDQDDQTKDIQDQGEASQNETQD